MNAIRVNITIDSLDRLTPVGVNTYNLVAVIFNSDGSILSNSNIPNNPYTATINTVSASFAFDIPIVEGSYEIPDLILRIFANNQQNCCFGIKAFSLSNSFDCQLTLDATFIQCNGILGIDINGFQEPVIFSVKQSSDLSEERFLDRSGSLIQFRKADVFQSNYSIQATDANGCTATDVIELTCATPNYSIERTPASCSGVTTIPATVRIYDVQNATRYKICPDSTFTCGNCEVSDGTFSPGVDTVINLPVGAAGTTSYSVIRFFNGSDCTLYSDYNFQYINPICTVAPTCPPDGTWTQNSEGKYYKTTTVASTAIPSGYLIVAKPNTYYAIDGTRLFNDDLTTYTTLTNAPMWKATSISTGPMNRCAIWTNKSDSSFPINALPLNSWLGFSKCLTGLTPGKKYYVGVEADNAFKLIVDGEIIYQILDGTTHFRTWKIIPIVAKKPDMLISMQGINNEYAAGFGCEIYDNNAAQIAAATSPSDLNIIFSSASRVGMFFDTGNLVGGIQYGYGCPDGYIYNPCTNACEKTDYCSV